MIYVTSYGGDYPNYVTMAHKLGLTDWVNPAPPTKDGVLYTIVARDNSGPLRPFYGIRGVTGVHIVDDIYITAEVKIGDRVRVIGDARGEARRVEGRVGTIIAIPLNRTLVGVEFDDDIDAHSCNGASKAGHGWWVETKSLVLITDGDNEMTNVDIAKKLREVELSDDNKKLIDRDLLNTDLGLNDKGATAFRQFLLNKFKSEFVVAIEALESVN